jgi:hypothetical protein
MYQQVTVSTITALRGCTAAPQPQRALTRGGVGSSPIRLAMAARREADAGAASGGKREGARVGVSGLPWQRGLARAGVPASPWRWESGPAGRRDRRPSGFAAQKRSGVHFF